MSFAIPGPRAPTGTPRKGCAHGPERGLERCTEPDALVLPADAGLALLRRPDVRTGPVAYDTESGCIQLLVPAGSADELPGLLEWLEWGDIDLGLEGRSPYRPYRPDCPYGACGLYGPREAAVWLRPPESGREADRIDLVRLVSAAATECHRARLRRTALLFRAQPLAFS